MPYIISWIFFLTLLALALLEGLGYPGGRELIFTGIIFLPLFFIPDFIKKRKLFFPKILGFSILGFSIFSGLSTFYSTNLGVSIKYFLYYISLFLMFLYALNHKEGLLKIIKLSIFILSFVFILFTLINTNIVGYWLHIWLPDSGYQFVYSKFGSHNHLGDFLVLPSIYCLYQFFKTKKKLFIFFFLSILPFFVLSFSRTAYFSLGITAFLLWISFIKKKVFNYLSYQSLFICVLLFSLFFLFFTVVKEFQQLEFIRPVNNYLVQNANLKDKYFRAKRVEYVKEASEAIKEKPLFGFGPGNFNIVSKKYSNIPNYSTDSSHNIFLDIAAENGLLALAFFLIFLAMILKSAIKNPNVCSFLFFAQLINFQTDYTHRIYSFLLLFFLLMGVIYNHKLPDNDSTTILKHS